MQKMKFLLIAATPLLLVLVEGKRPGVVMEIR